MTNTDQEQHRRSPCAFLEKFFRHGCNGGANNDLENGKRQRSGPSEASTCSNSSNGDATSMSASTVTTMESTTSHMMMEDASPYNHKKHQHTARNLLNNGPRTICGFEVLDTLGKGMSGKVKRGRCPSTGTEAALKIIEQYSRCSNAMVDTEIEVLEHLQHPNILSLLDYDLDAQYPEEKGHSRSVACLALELAPNGEIYDYIKHTGPLQEDIAKALFLQLISALAHCHDRCVYHRDIKPENILLGEEYQLKLADFGLAAITDDPKTLLTSDCGTKSYVAPEIFTAREYDGTKSDAWGAGMVLFIMLAGHPPFETPRPGDWWFDLLQKDPATFWRCHLQYCPDFPVGAQKLLSRVFSIEPESRASVKDLLSDPWFSSGVASQAEVKRDMRMRQQKMGSRQKSKKYQVAPL